MANKFKKGQILLFPMVNGETIQDSQCKPRYYLSEKSYNANCPSNWEKVEYCVKLKSNWVIESIDRINPDPYNSPGYMRANLHCANCGCPANAYTPRAPFDDQTTYPSEKHYKDAIKNAPNYCQNCGAYMKSDI